MWEQWTEAEHDRQHLKDIFCRDFGMSPAVCACSMSVLHVWGMCVRVSSATGYAIVREHIL